jgi:excisionase family DNA binding protein
MTDEPLTVNVRRASQVSGLPRDHLYAAIADGRLHVIRLVAVGRTIRVPVSELRRFVEDEANGRT